MPRKKIVPDAAVLEGVLRVMGRLGPKKFTLAAVGSECGMSAATLIQRFGSKRGMLLAIAQSGAGGMQNHFDTALKSSASPLAGLVDLFADHAQFVGKPEELANHLAFLQMDLSDPELHQHTLTQTKEMEKGVKRFLVAAVRADKLENVRSSELARAIVIAYQGALIYWCVTREGKITDLVRRQLEFLLAPYRK